jgi:MraZ protein
MNGFLGSYVHQVDDKGRLSLPASFRRGVDEGALVVMQVDDNSLALYPGPTWQEMSERLVEMRKRHPEHRAYILGITSRAVEVAPDKQGRILVPARLLQAIGISDSAMLIGAIDRIEVWAPERFEQATAERTPEAERFGMQLFA